MRVSVVAVMLAVLAVGCGGHAGGNPAATGTPAAPPGSARPSPTSSAGAGPSTSTLAGGFVPASVSFVDTDLGFALGGGPCAGPRSGLCNQLARTTDGGLHWRALSAPTTAIIDPYQRAVLRFADYSDGWAGGDGLQSTHDGGESWQPVDLPGLRTPYVAAIAVGDGLVEVLAGESTGSDTPPGTLRLWRSPVQFDGFTATPGVVVPGTAAQSLTLGAPPAASPSTLVAAASNSSTGPGWLVSADGRGRPELWTSPDGELWERRAQPCAAGDLAAAASTPPPVVTGASSGLTTAASAVTGAVLVCQGPGSGGRATKVVWTSADGGAHWLPRSAATQSARLAAGYLAGVVAPTAEATVLATSSTSDSLLHSADGGRTWTVNYVSSVSGVGQGLYDLSFTDSQHGVAVLGNAGVYAAERVDPRGDIPPPRLLVTADGGTDWTSVLVRR